MTLEEFKSIYFWEWFHRMWGRSLGVMFALPLAGFMAAKPTRNALKQLKLYPRLGVLFGLGGLQGLVGWWMVKSGLEHTHVLGIERDKDDMPKVSPYRLATHLSFAFVTYGLLAWTSMGLLSNSELAATEAKRLAAMSQDTLRSLGKFRTAVHATSTLMAITIVSGAFVAGNLAGLVYVGHHSGIAATNLREPHCFTGMGIGLSWVGGLFLRGSKKNGIVLRQRFEIFSRMLQWCNLIIECWRERPMAKRKPAITESDADSQLAGTQHWQRALASWSPLSVFLRNSPLVPCFALAWWPGSFGDRQRLVSRRS